MNAAIDVAIALMLMYLILSLIVTVTNEQIATALDLRAETLKSALTQLLDDPTLKTDFNSHGLIAGLNAAVSADNSSGFFRLITWLLTKLMRFQKTADDSHVSYLSGNTFALALLGSLDPTKLVPTFENIEKAVELMPTSKVRGALLAQITAANGDLDKLRSNVAGWFDSSMDRVSGIYKRDVRRISFTIGLLLAAIVNGDTFRVSQALWNDSSLRSGIADSASAIMTKIAATQPDRIKPDGAKSDNAKANGAKADDTKSDNTAPAVATPENAKPEAAKPENAKPGDNKPDSAGSGPIEKALNDIKDWQDQLRPFPLGWNTDPLGDKIKAWPSFNLAIPILVKILGLLLTAFAISLGAPFWFDMLGMFVQIRGTGKKPKKTQAT
jgi:hypothetical protein